MTEQQFEELLVSKGLYCEFKYTYDDLKSIHNFLKGNVNIDLYCSECNANRIFQAEENTSIEKPRDLLIPAPGSDGSIEDSKIYALKSYEIKNRITILTYRCTKATGHAITFVIMLSRNTLTKIGQYPSFADIDKPALNKYKNAIDESYFKELKRASGLYASGIGIGSFVYLRRIIEKLVDEAFQIAKKENKCNDDTYYREDGYSRRMDSKMKLLKDYLPETLVENTTVYGIVSKGIHELSEKECMEYYPIIEGGILLILHERKEMIERETLKKSYGQEIGKIKAKIQ